jgi:hypothetical protein
MKHVCAFLALALLAAGCADSKPQADASASSQPTGKPADDEARACIASYLGECGWREVEFASLADCTNPPSVAKVTGETWAFHFTARYTNIVGERQSSENWIALLSRVEGKPVVVACFDQSRQLVSGHRGDETTAIANLSPGAPISELPAIVAPKP